MKKIFLIAGLLLAITAVSVEAQTRTRSNSGRQVAQQSRIQEGKKSGELNHRETARLQREQRKIKIEKRIVNGDGTVTPKEKAFLRREQNRANKHIYREKHDATVTCVKEVLNIFSSTTSTHSGVDYPTLFLTCDVTRAIGR